MIVDLCSVVKELVENSIDAGASIVDVRFKNQGLDAIEVQDNGSGISSDNYESIALKHHTSKLSTYSDLDALKTFGFRGEALSSLCALSHFFITTCCAGDAPKATKLEFETSGKLKGTSVVAGQKGTAVSVNNLFHNLPVRRRELERNIKREWNKVISLLNQYACIQTGLKFTVSQQPTKGKRIVLFSTRGNLTTSENIVNIFGPKSLGALISLDISLEFEPTVRPGPQDQGHSSTTVRVQGFVSRPAHGEGRQTPDRQMFFVNGRPCVLPQFAKIFNEVYRAYNASQSPFIFADIQLDTFLYDVNVSPDKRTILMHEQGRMLETLREALIRVFESQDYSVPVSQPPARSGMLPSPGDQSARDPGASAISAPEAVHQTGHMRRMPDEQVLTEDPIFTSPSCASYSAVRQTPMRGSATRRPASREIPAQSLLSRWINTRPETSPPPREATGSKKDTNVASNSSPSEGRKRTAAEDLPTVTSHEEAEALDDESRQSRSSPQQASPPGGQGHTMKAHPNFLRGHENGSSLEIITGASGISSSFPNVDHVSPGHLPNSAVHTSTRAQAQISRADLLTTIGDDVMEEGTGRPTDGARCSSVSGTSESSTQSLPQEEPTRTRSFRARLKHMFSATSAGALPGSRAIGSSPEDESRTNDENSSLLDTSSRNNPVNDLALPQEKTATPYGDTGSHGPGLEEDSTNPDDNRDMEEHEGFAVPASPAEAANDTKVRSSGRKRRVATLNCLQTISVDESTVLRWSQVNTSWFSPENQSYDPQHPLFGGGVEAENAEESLSLIITKADFEEMKVVGQFNLGFILAMRHSLSSAGDKSTGDQLFIIDQHASDEKYNFERLQATTIVQSQRLVQAKRLDLTALEEEIVKENLGALELNGFKVHLDDSGDIPVGSRCELTALPLSRETTFTLSDLEELISLLGDDPSGGAGPVPRPSKVRKMFAMRACRSSVMIGKALSRRQMEGLVRHMGELDKPWNCPHGRPTMRHLCGLGPWDDMGWREDASSSSALQWATYAQRDSGQAK